MSSVVQFRSILAGQANGGAVGTCRSGSRFHHRDGAGRDRLAVESARRRHQLQSAVQELRLSVGHAGRAIHAPGAHVGGYPQTSTQRLVRPRTNPLRRVRNNALYFSSSVFNWGRSQETCLN